MSGSAVSELVLKFTGDTSNAMAAIGALDSKVAASAKNYVSSMGQMENSLGRMVSAHPAAVASIAALGAGLIYAGAKAVEAAASYDVSSTSLSNSAQISKKAADSIGASFLKTAGDSTFSAQQIMGAYSPVAGMLGNVEGHALTNADAMKVMTGSQELAEATGAELGKTTSNVASIMKDYHLNTNQAGQASNDLYNLQRLTGNSTDSLVVAFNRLQPAIAGSSITVDQSSGLMLEMTTAFGSGRKAIGLVGTTLQAMTEPSTAVQKALAAVGISLTDANGKFIGLGPALDAFKGYMDGSATATQKNALMQTVFGKNADDMKKIVEGGSAALDKNTKAISGNNDVSKAAGANAGTLEGQQKKLKAAFSDMAVVLGQILLPVVMNLMSAMMKVVTPIAAWVTQHKIFATVIGGVIAGVVGLTLAVIAITAVVGALTTVFGILTGEVIFFNIAILPVWAVLLIVVAAIAAVIAVVIVLIKYWDDVVQAFKNVVGWIVQAVDWFTTLSTPIKILVGVVALLVAPFLAVIAAVILLYQNWDKVWKAMTEVWNSFYSAVIEPIIHAWDAINWGAVWAGIQSVVKAVWDGIKSGWESFVGGLKTAWDAAAGPLKSAWDTTWSTMKEPFSELTDAFKGVGESLTSVWKSGISPAISSIKKDWDQIWGSLKDAVDNVGKSFSGIGKTITDMWKQSLKPALDQIGKAFSGLGKTAGDLWSKDIKPAFDAIGKAISGLWGGGSPAKQSAESATKGIKAVGTESHSTGSIIKTAFDAILDVIKFVLKVIAIEIEIVAAVIKAFAIVISWLAQNIIAPMFAMISTIITVAMAVIKIAIDIVSTVIKALAVVISWLAQNIVDPMLTAISAAFTVAAVVIGAVIKTVGAIITALGVLFSTVFNAIVVVIDTVWSTVKTDTIAIWDAVVSFVTGLWTALRVTATTLFTTIQNVVQFVWDTIKTAATTMWNAISLVIQAVWNALKLAATTIFTAIQNAIQAVWDSIKSAASTVWHFISDNIIQPIWNALKTAAGTVFTGIQNAIQGVWDNIKSAAKTMWDAIVQAVKTAWGVLKQVVEDPINVVIKVVNFFIDGANKVLGIVGIPAIPDIPGPVKLASGGQVPGGWGGGDTVPAMLTPGERVLSTRQVRQMGGHNNIDNMLGMAHGGAVPNSGMHYFANGGVVPPAAVQTSPTTFIWQGQTYQDTKPKGHNYTDPNFFAQFLSMDGSAQYASGGVHAINTDSGGGFWSKVGGAISNVVGDVTGAAGVVTSALAGLGEIFIKGALIAAATVALAPLKAAVGLLPDKPFGAELGKHTGNKVLDGIYKFITMEDNKKGQDPVSTAIGGVPVTSDLEAAALKYAEATFAGLPYTWGNNDCSGIVQKSYSHVGVSLPRVSSTQYQASTPVTEAQAVPGDLAFYNPGESGAPAGLPGHVGFYAGNGKIFDAYNTSRPIGFDPLSLPGNTFMGIRRPGSGTGGGAQGPAPAGTGPGSAMTAQQWAVDFLGMLGAPTNPGMVNFIWEWEAAEGGTWLNAEQHNPLNIAAFDNNPNNSQSNFPTWAAGLAAAVRVLGQSNMSGLRAGIMSGNPAAALAALVASPWASSHYNGGASFPKSPGSYGSTPHLAEGGIVGYDVGAWDTGYRAHMAMIHPSEMIIPAGPASAIRSGANVFGGDGEYVSNRNHGTGHGIDYDKLAVALKAHSSVHVDNINVTQSDASPSDIMDEFNWNMRVARLAV